MNKARIAAKAAKQKASNETDPGYIALRMKGLAQLVFCASGENGIADPIDHEAAFFISTELEDMAAKLGAR